MGKKATVPNIIWIIIGIVIIIAFAILFWLMTKGWLVGGAKIVDIFAEKAGEAAEEVEVKIAKLILRAKG